MGIWHTGWSPLFPRYACNYVDLIVYYNYTEERDFRDDKENTGFKTWYRVKELLE